MGRAIMECGWPAWAVLALAAVGSTAGIAAIVLAVARSRRLAFGAGGATLALAGLVLALGAMARANGRAMIEDALATLETEYRDEIRAAGYREAESCISVAYASAVLPGVLGAVGIVAAALRPRR
jgi:hypothetical protein